MMQITMDEVKELSRTELEACLSALLAADHDEEGAAATEYETLASIEAVSKGIMRKLPAEVQRPENYWL